MAKHLDLEEQEQLDETQALLEPIRQPHHLGADRRLRRIAAWNGWQYWQRTQARRPPPCTTRWSAPRRRRHGRVERAFAT
jgi:hypothetical protein